MEFFFGKAHFLWTKNIHCSSQILTLKLLYISNFFAKDTKIQAKIGQTFSLFVFRCCDTKIYMVLAIKISGCPIRTCLNLIKYTKVTSCSQVIDCVLLNDSLLKAIFCESFSLHFTFPMRCAQLSAKLRAPKMKIILADARESPPGAEFSLFNVFKYLR